MYGEILKKKFKKMLKLTADEMGANIDDLLLQEQKKKSAEAIAELLRNATGE